MAVTVHVSVFSAEILTDGRCFFLSAEEQVWGGREQATSRRTGTRTVDD